MSHIRVILLILLLFAAGVGQTGIASAFAARVPPQTDKEIQSIRQSYAAINRKQARYRKVRKDLSGFSAEGGVLVAYFEGPAIVKIVATYYGEGGRSYEEYYYRNEKLIFVLRKESRYSRPLSGKVVSTKLDRFYFHDDKLIRWIDENGKQVSSDSREYAEKQNEYLTSSKQFTEGARSKNPTIESN